LASFHTLLYSHRVRRKGVDKLWWVPSQKGRFDVRSFYRVLGCKDDASFPWKSIWRTKVLLKVAFFVWSATLGKILTMDNLRKRHIIVVDRCWMCKRNEEFMDYLLIIVRLSAPYRMLFSAALG
jgi:hypothetical protein